MASPYARTKSAARATRLSAPPAGPPTGLGYVPGLDCAPTWADEAELDRFAAAVAKYVAGDLDPESFRRIRLRHGVYGQRELTDVHMVRVKLPGGALTAAALEALADIAGRWSRGWGHLTTRQNVEFHSIGVRNVPDVLRRLAAAGLTSSEACGDTVRNVTACPLAGVCRGETLDVNAAAEAVARHFLRSPLTQSLPRKFKIAVSGCAADCARTGIHDIGITATERDGRAGFRMLVGGGLGTGPREAVELEPFTDPTDLLVTAEAVLRVWNQETPDPSKRARTRLKYLIARVGIDAFRDKVLAQRQQLRRSASYRGKPPELMLPPRTTQTVRRPTAAADAAPGAGTTGAVRRAPASPVVAEASAHGTPLEGYLKWESCNVVAQRQPGRYAAHATVPLGDLTAEQFRVLAAAASQLGITWRTTVRQNLVARDILAADLPRLHGLLAAAGLGASGVDTAADVASCPGTDTCNLALTASRGAARAITDALHAAGLGEVPLNISVSGCPNSCGQQQMADIGLSGQVRRAGGDEAPGYRILLGGGTTAGGVRFGTYAAKAPAKRVPEAIVALVGRYARERAAGERFGAWAERVGLAALGAWLGQFDDKRARQQAPYLYTDWGETKRFEVILGRGECAS